MKKVFTIDPKHHGYGPCMFSWHPECQYLASAGTQGDCRVVHIWDRYGQLVDDIPLTAASLCRGLEWDKDGEMLAVLQSDSGIVLLWERKSRKVISVDTNFKDLTFLKWSKVGNQLAIGNAKGNLMIYVGQKKIPILGKHTRRITCGAWNLENKLALGADDKQITISNADGDTHDQTSVKYEPVDIQFSEMKVDEKVKSKESTVSINMGRKTILLYNMNDRDNPVELAFQPRYGLIVAYRWFGDGYIMIGFSSGYLVIISTHMKEIGEELFSNKIHDEQLTDIALSPAVQSSPGAASLQRAASAGDNTVKIVDLGEWKELKNECITLDGNLRSDKLQWSADGHILSISTTNGTIVSYMARIPVLNHAYDTKLVYLTSLRELSVQDTVSEEPPLVMQIATEPTFVALGPLHVAVGMNNRVWYYRCERNIPEASRLITEREYLGTVEAVRLNRTHTAVLTEGKVQLHPIESRSTSGGVNSAADSEPESRTFPDEDKENDITCVAMTNDFVIYGTAGGTIRYFYLADWTWVNEYRHDTGILGLYPNALGTRCLFLDNTHSAFLYNPVNDQKVPVPRAPGSGQQIWQSFMWDSADNGVFVSSDPKDFSTYMYSPTTIAGAKVDLVGQTKRPPSYVPILAFNGQLHCQLTSGQLANILLSTHEWLGASGRQGDRETKRQAFAQNMAIRRLKDAWDIAVMLDQKDVWKSLADAAMNQLDMDLAIRVYRQMGDAGMVIGLQKIQSIEDKNLLAGHIALLFADYSTAQELFLSSSRPITALEMRRDLLHWDQALKLANTLAPSEVPFISREYAQQLEFKGEYSMALQMYERGMTRNGANPDHQMLCVSGIARMNIRLGNIPQGVNMAIQSGNKQLCRECAIILESMKQLQDAAMLYEKGELYEKAASIYITTRNLISVAALIPKITSPKLHQQYAKAKEADGNFQEAAAAYERAKDMDNVVRLNLEQLHNPQKAMAIVRKTRSQEGASMVAAFCQQSGDFKASIEFLLIAKRTEEAFELAQAHEEMDTYCNCIGEGGNPDEYAKVAQYYEGKGNAAMAGRYFAICAQYHKALKLYLQCGEKEIDRAIEVVGKARSDVLTHTLIDFLMGETDGMPKDPTYIFRLYMSLGNFPQAAKTAIIIARQEQELGNYKVAHQLLYDTYKDLEGQHIKVPQELSRNLCLLHSYILVKVLVKNSDHLSGARMLIRVAKNISKFPSHIVQILTSTVIECQRSGLKRSAFEYASMLMRAEYRQQINAQYKRKIEAIVRKPDKNEEEEPNSPCPHCGTLIPETQLDCPNCKNTIPYCIATGRHMVLDEWSQCPSCRFPALLEPFRKLIEAEKLCPICSQEIVPSIITKCDNPTLLLKKVQENTSQDGG